MRLFVTAGASLILTVPLLAQAPPATKGLESTKAETPHLSLTTSTSAPAVVPGGRVSLLVDVVPKPKMHVYSPEQKELIPISITLESDARFKAHQPVFPKPETYFFAPLKETQLVYSKRFQIVQEVTLAPAAALGPAATSGSLTIKGTVRYQACDDKVCYTPRNVPVSWTVALKR